MMRKFIIDHFFVIILSVLLGGCISSTEIVKNKNPEIAKKDMSQYKEVYFVPPKSDTRNVSPRAVQELKSMGFDVKVVDPEKPIGSSQGTGFIVTPAGHIITCAHVLDEKKEATIWISGTRYEADVVNSNKELDVAILKIRTSKNIDISPVSFRTNKTYGMGEDAFTIGYPMSSVLGDSSRMTKGLISSTKGLKDDPKQMQISAEIQPGNSGGPLLDKDGLLIGVIQQTLNPWRVAQETGGALPQNINFAIKSDVILDYVKSNNKELYDKLTFNKALGFEKVDHAVVKIRSGIVPEGADRIPKLVIKLDYLSIWDMWYRFKVFVVAVYDFDSREALFVAGQGRDNVVSNEDVVIKDTFEQVRRGLGKSSSLQK